MSGASCLLCDRPLARWLMQEDENVDQFGAAVCSLCVLYDSKWAKTAEVALFAQQIEQATSVSFQRDPDGRLLSPEEADRVLGAIVFTSRMFEMRGLVK